jgi:hypothetical protein
MVLINSAESNRARIRYAREAAWGVTPSSGVTKEMRLTASGLEASKETETSQEIRADRMVPNIVEVGAMSGGNIDFELSAGSIDDFLAAFVLSEWSQPMNYWQVKGAQVTITDTDEITILGIDATNYLEAGQWLKLEGFLIGGNNTYVSIDAVAFTGGNTEITVDQTTLTVEGGTAFTKVMDANDVFYFGAAEFTAGNTIDGGTNAFQNANLSVGQKIWVEGLGKGVGSILVNATDPVEGALITLGDGANTLVFEVRTNAALVTEGRLWIARSGTEATMAANIAAAVQAQFAQGKIRISASAATDTVTFVNHRPVTGGTLTVSDAVAFTVTAFSGGSATKSGFFTIASLPDADTIVTVETLSTDANSGTLNVVVKGSHIRNRDASNIVKQSFTLETGFTDVSKYFVMNGQRVGSYELNVEAGSIVTGSIDFMGRETIRSSVETLGNTGVYDVQDSTATEVLNATSNVGQVSKNGVPLSTAIRSISISGDAALREQRAVGEKFPAGIGYGRLSITGSVEAYFETFDLYDEFINHTTTNLGFDFTDVDNNTYFFRLPALKFTANPIAPGGIDEDVMENLEFEAQRDPVLDTMFLIDRFSSNYPFVE